LFFRLEVGTVTSDKKLVNRSGLTEKAVP